MNVSCASAYRDKILHLYRALLREATYLPDPQARAYIWSYIVARYRQNSKKIVQTKDRSKRWVGSAQQSLHILQNANNGKLHPLSKILYHAYGRLGKRRHQLLQPLLNFHSTDPQTSTDEASKITSHLPRDRSDVVIKALLEQFRKVSQPSQFKPQLPPRLKALLESQLSANLPAYARQPLLSRLLSLKLPNKNNVGRKLPDRRAANLIRRWYGSVLDRALPPIPEEEWQRLRGLITEGIKWQGPLKRRPGNETSTPPGPARLEESLEEALGIIPTESKLPSPADGDHRFTLRYMQRLWIKAFSVCSRMIWNSQRKAWEVQWGYQSIPKSRVSNAESDAYLFEGVDSQGKKVTN
ncbi:MAG: hypothetical protein M1821_008222 [Bathelium mastoideum]|nr:MAG: hypothetical protein M1821_008222 [Bathelium mastoideum]KAI9693267.1 MAG: hypothetical protein M1822_005263 [Bathelium mastoideum]